jgi:hypothetical protein
MVPYESLCFSSVAFNTRNELGVLNEHFTLRDPRQHLDKLDSQLQAQKVFVKGATAPQPLDSQEPRGILQMFDSPEESNLHGRLE